MCICSSSAAAIGTPSFAHPQLSRRERTAHREAEGEGEGAKVLETLKCEGALWRRMCISRGEAESRTRRRTVRQNLKAKVQKSWKAAGSASTSSSTPGSARFTCATVVAFSAASPAAR